MAGKGKKRGPTHVPWPQLLQLLMTCLVLVLVDNPQSSILSITRMANNNSVNLLVDLNTVISCIKNENNEVCGVQSDLLTVHSDIDDKKNRKNYQEHTDNHGNIWQTR